MAGCTAIDAACAKRKKPAFGLAFFMPKRCATKKDGVQSEIATPLKPHHIRCVNPLETARAAMFRAAAFYAARL
jgi:hypothetical protein